MNDEMNHSNIHVIYVWLTLIVLSIVSDDVLLHLRLRLMNIFCG
jgi:hypothetical protein